MTTNLNIGQNQEIIFVATVNGKEMCFHNGGNGFCVTHAKGTIFCTEAEFNTYLKQAKDATK